MTRLDHRKSYLVIICPNSHTKLMKSSPKVKLGKVEVGSNIAQNHSSSHRKSYLVIMYPNSHDKLTINEIRSSYYLQQFGFIYVLYLTLFGPKIQFVSIFSITYLYLPLFTYIWPYLGFIAIIWAYLPLICPYFTIYATFTLYMDSSIDSASLFNIFEQSDHYAWRYCISKIWRIQRCLSTNAVWVLI